MERYTILAFMIDRPGVLNKIASLIRRKMYNIDTLTVCQTQKPGISRMTITLHSDSNEAVEKMIKQIEKQIEVISVEFLQKDKSFWREVALIKTNVSNDRLEELSKFYDFQFLEKGIESIIQIAGTMDRIDEFIKEIGREFVVEIARTGPTALKI
ncbi:MAG TPA: acetolactate synthase small subunit [Candidatus Dojkabacteria bacterium]|jgi:acetolactate synthase-1/3 small subunit